MIDIIIQDYMVPAFAILVLLFELCFTYALIWSGLLEYET